ncbi:hypothetical protein MS2017_1373 [Bathymodiolus thermophilus thioautotrophic gill symbiont]|uniref:Conjugal transfer protein TraN n=1 Tax=Bathymodiolus thermophilus thioautotrophic gill symbiont TaxID=2360 RepID=A0A3G3IMP4_9GAMM|nr:conjugal transfer protein TraN [Bathymodiolus thermophilus thioautotrophic gill symbiont]AYQ57061.1 hypothetical protein MS2017_1373 [Bathymodiolus thermophilus thioautotrophic gill symbiont]
MIKLNSKIRIALCIVFIYLNPVHASNFVCGQDIDGNGDIGGIGENASCQVIGTEQFCSVGAQTCDVVQTYNYKCDLDESFYDDENTCKSSCKNNAQVIEIIDIFYYNSSIFWFSAVRFQGRQFIFFPASSNWDEYTKDKVKFKKVLLIKKENYPDASTPYFILKYNGTATTLMESSRVNYCSKNNINNTYSCPTAGNSCVNVDGIQKCSINPCIDLDVTPPKDVTPPSVIEIDDGERSVDGACMDQALMFSGRNLSCKYSGITKNCCKDTGVVYRDSSGSMLSNTAKSMAIVQTYGAVSAAYTAYTASAATGATAAASSAAASSAAQSAFVGVDPYTVAVVIAIQVISKFISCGQQDTEAAMLNGSGYCHLIGTYCSKEWTIGCVQRSKSYCCFNSKLGRILQEQGRAQMGKSWGSAKSPSCGGFTPDEFQSLDFSRIDLTEYYGDMKSKGDSLIQKNITDSVTDYYKQIKK